MQINIHPSWQKILSPEFEKLYFNNLMLKVEEEYDKSTCFPPKELIFNAFNQFDYSDLKVVIIGQDPYHGEGEANGLCFSVNDQVKIPPSLRNIFAEINDEYGNVFYPTTGNLERWAKQGILLLNTSLTVKKDVANSHKHVKWKTFTDAVIKKISEENNNIVFLLWGKFAQQKIDLIDSKKHEILQCGHPSFAHSHKQWFKNNHFILTNKYLVDNKKNAIEW